MTKWPYGPKSTITHSNGSEYGILLLRYQPLKCTSLHLEKDLTKKKGIFSF